MEHELKILGYYIQSHQYKEEGHAGTSLEDLVAQGHESKLPFLNRGRLDSHLSGQGDGIPESTIMQATVSDGPDKVTWSPTARFFHQMSEAGKFQELGIPQDRLLITANRKNIQRIIEFLQDPFITKLELKIKMKNREYGRELTLATADKSQQNLYLSRLAKGKLRGHHYNAYLVDGDNEQADAERRKFTLFSIHALTIKDACFIYEAEIDAVERNTSDSEGDATRYSILEIKTHYKELSVVAAFEAYTELSREQELFQQRNETTENTTKLKELRKLNQDLLLPFLQGELGCVNKFIYGFMRNKMTARELPCYPGTLLRYQIKYLHDFVKIIRNTSVASTTMNEWEYWEFTKFDNTVELNKVTRELLAKVELGSTETINQE